MKKSLFLMVFVVVILMLSIKFIAATTNIPEIYTTMSSDNEPESTNHNDQCNLLSDYEIYCPLSLDKDMILFDNSSPSVELSLFNIAITGNLHVQLQWTAETETHMLGYNVFRSQVEEIAESQKINNKLIGAYNSSTPTDYSYVDVEVNSGETYYYWLEFYDTNMTSQFYGPISVLVNEKEEDPVSPEALLKTKLIGSYPNPFNPGTYIAFSLDETARVTISIYNNLGQFIRTLTANREFEAGRQHSVYFDGKNHQGKDITSGIYFYILKTDTGYREARKMLLLK